MSDASHLYISYDQVPYYRKQWFFWSLYFIFSPIAIGILLSGDVYYPRRGKVQSFGVANRIVAGILAVLILFSVINAFTPLFNHSATPSDQQVVELMQKTSNELNKKLPIMVNKVTRLDSTIAGPGKTWTYMYTIVSPSSSSLTQKYLDKYLDKKIHNGVCTSDSMKGFISNGVQVKYIYRANTGKFIGSIVVSPSECRSGT